MRLSLSETLRLMPTRRHLRLLRVPTLAERLRSEAVGWWNAADIVTGGEQSLPNRNAHLPNAAGPLVRGAVRGAELAGELYTPGTTTDYAEGPRLDLSGNDVRCEILFSDGVTYADYRDDNAGLGGFVGDRGGSSGEFVLRKRPEATDDHELNLFWFSAAGSYRSTQSTEPPRAEAVGIAAHRTSAGGGLYAVRFYDTLDGSNWIQVGDMRAQSVAPGVETTTMKVGYDGSSALVHHIAKVTFWDAYQTTPETPIASPDFAGQLAGTQAFDDEQGNTWTLRTAADISEPEFDSYQGTHYAKFTGESDGARITVGSATTTSTSQWTQYAAFYKDDWSNSGLQLVCGGDDRIQISSNGVRFGFVKPDGGSEYTPYATVAEIGAIDFENISVRCDWDEDNNTATVYARPGVEDFQEGDWGDAKVVLDGPSTNRRGSSVTVALGAFSASGKLVGGIYRCGSTVAGVYDWEFNPDKHNPAGARAYTDPYDNYTSMSWGAGPEKVHVRYVTASAVVGDSIDDYMQSDYTPGITKNSGGLTVMVKGSIPDSTSNYRRFWSAEEDNNNGTYSANSSGGAVYSAVGSGAIYSTAQVALTTYEDGTPFAIVSVIDGDSQRVKTITDREPIEDNPINQAMSTVELNPIRFMSRGDAAFANPAMVWTEAIIWDKALSQSDMEAIVNDA